MSEGANRRIQEVCGRPPFSVAPTMSATDVSFVVPWTPTLCGCPLDPFKKYEDLVQARAYPQPDKHREWTQATILPLTQSVPAAEGAIWECVCALWRLQQLGEPTVKALWGTHVSAWLVRR